MKKEISLSQKGYVYSQNYGFPVVIYRCQSWTMKKAKWQRTDGFQTVVLEKTLESPLDSKETKPVNPKEINPE